MSLALAQRTGGFNKLLVLKLLREELAADPEFLEMFLAEARVAALLNHPNIVQTNEVGTERGRHFIAMEYLEGQPLSALIARVGRKTLPLELQVFALAQVLHGLHYAHELTDLDGSPLSLIHRDVSPQNVFLTYSGQVKLLDFGIAKVAGAAALTKQGILKGKLGYIAPEQARTSMSLDHRADLFAIGVMLWEAIAQRRFVPANDSELEIVQKRISNEDVKLADVAPDADPSLAAICNKAVAFQPDDRWPDAQKFAEALEGWLPRSKHALEKELGALLVDTFKDERSRIRRIVEEESAKSAGDEQASGLRESLPTLDGVSTVRSDLSVGVATSAPKPELKSRTLKWTAAAAFLACVGGGGALFVRSARQDSASATSQPVEAARTTSTSVAVRIRSTPSNATVTIDDGTPRAAPYDGTAPRDEARHKIRLIAEGYDAEERTVSFGSDVDLDVALRKTAAGAQGTAGAATSNTSQKGPPTPWPPVAPLVTGPRPKASTTPSDPLTATKKARYSIDETDPYGHK